MKKILFLTNTLNYRGTTTALLDYAHHTQELLGHEAIIGYDETVPYEQDMSNEDEVVNKVKSKFKTVHCIGANLQQVIDDEKIDLIYRLGSGEAIENKTATPQAYHAVFQHKNDTITAYISEWLSKTMTNGKVPYVPHMIDLPSPTKNFRDFLGIPQDALVIGRHGGFDSFDIPFVKKVVEAITKDVYFLFVNTRPFCSNTNILHINAIHDKQKLSNYINTCDAMLHARGRGESFGLAIAEFLSQNKPVYAWEGGHDKNHLNLTKYLYNDADSLIRMIYNTKLITQGGLVKFNDSVKTFTPKRVMASFNKFLIEGTNG